MPDHNGCSSVQGSLLPVLLPWSGSLTPQTNQDTSGTMRRSTGAHHFLYYNLFLKEFYFYLIYLIVLLCENITCVEELVLPSHFSTGVEDQAYLRAHPHSSQFTEYYI